MAKLPSTTNYHSELSLLGSKQQLSSENKSAINSVNDHDSPSELPENLKGMTHLASEHPETVISDKTDIVDNNNFLRAVFGEELNDAYPIIVSFPGNPSTVQKNKWFGRPWARDLSFIAGENNYFSLAKLGRMILGNIDEESRISMASTL